MKKVYVWLFLCSLFGVSYTYAAGTNKTFSQVTFGDGSVQTTAASGTGGGTSIYSATSTAIFPLGVSASTGVFSSSITISNPGRLLLPDGSASFPSWAWASNTNTGAYKIASNEIGVSAGGTSILEISNTKFISSDLILAPDGTAAAPSYTFGSDQTTGFERPGSSQIGASLGGVVSTTFTSTGLNTLSLLVDTSTFVNTNDLFQVGASTTVAVTKNGHMENHQPIAPVESSCGGAAPNIAAGSTDRAGAMQTGTAASACTVTFGSPWTNAPFCVVSDNSTTSVTSISSISTTQLVVSITTSLSGGFIYYICEGYQ